MNLQKVPTLKKKHKHYTHIEHTKPYAVAT